MKCVIVLLILISWHLYQSIAQTAKTRTWKPNTNYDEPKNWLGHKLPCEGSKIIFPEDLNAAIYLPDNVNVREIVLPNDGELIIKAEGIMQITGQDDFSCERKEVLFKKLNIEPWFKPSNWKTSNIPNIAIPHSERVPCIYDNVVFPNKSSFWVQYPEISISVNSFQLEGESLTNDELQRFLLSEPGQRQFRNFDYQYRTDVLNVEDVKCLDKSGCLCHKSNYVEIAVCKNLQQVCNVTHCLDPVQPNGHCCKLCGAHLMLKFNKNNFNLQKFDKTIKEHLNIYGYADIDVHISKILHKFDTYIQIVIIEKDFKYNGYSTGAAQNLHDLFKSNVKEFDLISSELFISGPEYYPGQQLKKTIAMILGTLLLVLLGLTIVYVKYETEKGMKLNLPFSLPNLRNFNPFIFVRFENTGDGDTGLEFRNRSVASSLFNLDRAFDNPMFEGPGPASSQIVENIEEKLHIDFKNPLYSELKEKTEDLELE